MFRLLTILMIVLSRLGRACKGLLLDGLIVKEKKVPFVKSESVERMANLM
jgi:hypothetical protein